MNVHDALDRLHDWRSFNYFEQLPRSIVLAEPDWLAYVQAMAHSLPAGETLDFPTEEDVLWSWPDGVLVLFTEPVDVEHTIISQETRTVLGTLTKEMVPAHYETQVTAAFAICETAALPSTTPDGTPIGTTLARPCVWIGDDPYDIVTGHWTPGGSMLASASAQPPFDDGTLALALPHGGPREKEISYSSRLGLSIITALGHRLTKLDEPGALPITRGEKRRMHRELPALRVLRLTSGASVSKSQGGKVEWSRRWMVRGHWRLQPYGPERRLRKPVWIDPYVKGPADKPFDARPTVWRAHADEEAS